jgi:predicted solute-binding protein
VRRAFQERDRAATATIHRLLLQSKELGKADLAAVARYACAQAGQTPEECARYLGLLRFDLSELDQGGLAEMERYLTSGGALGAAEGMLRAGAA